MVRQRISSAKLGIYLKYGKFATLRHDRLESEWADRTGQCAGQLLSRICQRWHRTRDSFADFTRSDLKPFMRNDASQPATLIDKHIDREFTPSPQPLNQKLLRIQPGQIEIIFGPHDTDRRTASQGLGDHRRTQSIGLAKIVGQKKRLRRRHTHRRQMCGSRQLVVRQRNHRRPGHDNAGPNFCKPSACWLNIASSGSMVGTSNVTRCSSQRANNAGTKSGDMHRGTANAASACR